jgi:NADPH:quinone reductase-like Zn-dependent oxidoreductase
MKALVFDRSGLENLGFRIVDDPKVEDNDVLIKVLMAGVNPVDYYTVTSLKVNPLPHIPGVEFAGEVVKVGSKVSRVSVGEKVSVYGRIFDGYCDFCLAGYENLCRFGGRIGVDSNGGWAEFISVEEKYVFPLPRGYDITLASSLPVAGLTAYHSLLEAKVRPNEFVAIFGASGNTGMFLVQLAKRLGARVIAISRKGWLRDFGADYVLDYSELDRVMDITQGRGVDVVVNSLGSEYWDKSFEILGVNGRLVNFGTLTGSEVKVNLSKLYSKHARIIGITRGTRREFYELIKLCKDCKVKVWKVFKLENGKEALKSLFSRERDGRIMLKPE